MVNTTDAQNKQEDNYKEIVTDHDENGEQQLEDTNSVELVSTKQWVDNTFVATQVIVEKYSDALQESDNMIKPQEDLEENIEGDKQLVSQEWKSPIVVDLSQNQQQLDNIITEVSYVEENSSKFQLNVPINENGIGFFPHERENVVDRSIMKVRKEQEKHVTNLKTHTPLQELHNVISHNSEITAEGYHSSKLSGGKVKFKENVEDDDIDQVLTHVANEAGIFPKSM
ncbi:hypothetical protein K7X08_022187 [Anisodus acutangulus]|uniref:Uncharacterized protein n=1 Tax=Anisodus acutangulus TaxID=402998 RepID=A0A9Q1QVD7_9SOLA|nr:hypothetical protein K7X08_022187 [Anisodus acutangulus]